MKIAYLIAGAAALTGGAILWWLMSPAPMMNIGFASNGGYPVVVREFILNSTQSGLFKELVVDGGGDKPPRTSGSGNYMVSYRKGWGDDISIDITWVELSSGEAWRAETSLSVKDMERSASGAVQLLPILAPGGLLIISSDPIPGTARDQTVSDLARICGTRVPELDKNYTSNPRALPGLWEASQTVSSAPFRSECES
ncbi:hypothetical protein ACLBWZ_08840 [Brucellaceae bacterium C25G]